MFNCFFLAFETIPYCFRLWLADALSLQVAHRMRLSRSFLSATKKFFTSAVGGSAQNSLNSTSSNALSQPPNLLESTNTPSLIGMSGSGGNWPLTSGEVGMTRNSMVGSREDVRGQQPPHPPASAVPVVVYTTEAPEMQMRRLADLAFLFQQYEVAHQTYNVLKRDFQNDGAWLHYAAAQVWSAILLYFFRIRSIRPFGPHATWNARYVLLLAVLGRRQIIDASEYPAFHPCFRHSDVEAAPPTWRASNKFLADIDLVQFLLVSAVNWFPSSKTVSSWVLSYLPRQHCQPRDGDWVTKILVTAWSGLRKTNPKGSNPWRQGSCMRAVRQAFWHQFRTVWLEILLRQLAFKINLRHQCPETCSRMMP